MVAAIEQPAKGVYVASTPSDRRSPCPMINCLANHGYLPRDGRNVHHEDFYSGMDEIGVSRGLSNLLVNGLYNVPTSVKPSLLTSIWDFATNPWSILSRFGMRRPGEVDADGQQVLDLDQLGLHNAVEHDVSLTRRDFSQGDNITPQPDLVDELLSATSDGKTFTMEDLAMLRKRRIAEQRRENPNLDYSYNGLSHTLACGEISLVLKVLGDGQSVKYDFVRAFFQEERLPVKEGWTKREWPVGMLEVKLTADKVKAIIGPKL